MPELIAKPALAGLETIGTVTLSAWDPGQITSIALFPKGAKAVAKALKPLGLTFPAPNAMGRKGEARIVWTGREQAFLLGAVAPDFGSEAAVTDQSGGWAGIAVDGADALDVLARLVPLDLAAMPVGGAARAPLGHMAAVVMRVAAQRVELLVFRSMARTAWHELHEAALRVAARAAV